MTCDVPLLIAFRVIASRIDVIISCQPANAEPEQIKSHRHFPITKVLCSVHHSVQGNVIMEMQILLVSGELIRNLFDSLREEMFANHQII